MNHTKTIGRRILPALLAALMLAALLAFPISILAASETVVTTEPTGYTKAEDVVYKEFSDSDITGVMNWGARGEDCVFLSPYAEAYYDFDISYKAMTYLQGGTSQLDAHMSDLYAALRDMMIQRHTHVTDYGETRPLYAYTDCVSNEPSQLVSFYSGQMHTSAWDGGATWNREHTWPNSKCINTNKTKDSADIMMLRPTLKSENGSRGNKSYGESNGYFDPGASVRGDCARIVLYVYTRWGNTDRMWGATGVIENVDVLLSWMAEDPVDTWEMGRNDAVESITGVRNVFVDYPEYAWLLFGREVPADIVTPSAASRVEPETEAPTEAVTEAETVTVTEPESVTEAPTETGITTEAPTETETESFTVGETQAVTPPETTMNTDATAGTPAATETEPSGKEDGCRASLAGMSLVIMLILPFGMQIRKRD